MINAVHLRCVFSFIYIYPALGLLFTSNVVRNYTDTGNNQMKVQSKLNWIMITIKSIVHINMLSNWTIVFCDPFTEQ